MAAASARGRIGEADVQALLGFIGELNQAEGPDEFRASVLPGIRGLVRCEIATYNEVDFLGGTMVAMDDPPGSMSADAIEVFLRHGRQNPLVTRYERTRDGRPYMWSDMFTRRELHRTDIYHEAYALMGVEYQMAFALPAPPELIIAFALNRGSRNFSERDRRVINIVRGPMIQALRNVERYAALTERVAGLERGLEQRGGGVVLLESVAGEPVVGFASDEAQRSLALGEGSGDGAGRALPAPIREWLTAIRPQGAALQPLVFDGPGGSRTAVHLLPARRAGDADALLVEPIGELLAMETLRAAGLTQREAEVMRLLALGHSNSGIAADLVVSPRTVHKHLQNAYEKLGAGSRTQAVQAAWSIGRPAPTS